MSGVVKASFGCRCGEVQGCIEPAAPRLANRVICYCDDCQAFAHYLGRRDLLDDKGGSDIVQIPPAALSFSRGQDRIGALRLSAKGLYRWRATCCQSPLGSTMGPAVPFVSVTAASFADADALFGAPRGAIMGQFAIGAPPPRSTGVRPWLMASTVAKIVGWRLAGRTWPHPFFKRGASRPIYPVVTLSKEERDRLRPLCGPRLA